MTDAPASRLRDAEFERLAEMVAGYAYSLSERLDVGAFILEARRAREAEEMLQKRLDDSRSLQEGTADLLGDAEAECVSLRGLVEQYSATCERLEKVIAEFLVGYDKAAPSVEGVYSIAFVHGFKYSGYQYTAELKALRDVVAAQPPAPAKGEKP
jgi:hypothetical protein